MPSIRKQALSYIFLAALLSITSTASPLPKGSNSSPGGPPNSNASPGGDGCAVTTTTVTIDPTSTSTIILPSSTIPSSTSSTVAVPVATPTLVAKLPSTGTSTELPSTNNSVKFVAIGRGIQNYSCTAINATPVSIGAIAVLFDYTSLASSNETELHTLPGTAVNVAFDPFTATPTSLAGLPAATVLGHHFFAADATPTFNLTGAPVADEGNMILFGNKTASVTAPGGSPLGPSGTGAVAWLQLEAKTNIISETSVGLKEAYRVETAGGNPEALCSEVGTMSINYAAEYWFYD